MNSAKVYITYEAKCALKCNAKSFRCVQPKCLAKCRCLTYIMAITLTLMMETKIEVNFYVIVSFIGCESLIKAT